MENEFLPYELALALKELGFDEMCFAWYHHKLIVSKDYHILEYEKCKNEESWITGKHCAAPLYQQAFRWFLKEYKLFPETTLWGDGIGYMSQIKEIRQAEFLEVYMISLATPNRGIPNWDREVENIACLKKLIEIVKEKQDGK